jgi:hypothetical protein
MNVNNLFYNNADKALRKDSADEVHIHKKLPNNPSVGSTDATVNTDTISRAPEIEHYNNYTKIGLLIDYANETNTGSAEKCEIDTEVFPWWLLKLIKETNADSDWILQLLEEAGIENIDLDNITSAEELLIRYGSSNISWESKATEGIDHDHALLESQDDLGEDILVPEIKS